MTNILLLSEDHQILGRGYCSGYLDIYQKFNTGFYCPEPMVFCCGVPTYKYCCTTKESLIAEKNNELDQQAAINKAPITLAIISGITLLSIFIIFASCYFCSCCLVYKKRQTQLSRGLYRIQQGTTSSFGNYCSPSSLNSSVTTPLDNDLIHLIHQLPTPTSSSSTNNLNRISNNSFSPCNFTPNNFGGGQNQFSQYLRNSQSNLPRFVPPPTPPPYYIFNESRRPLSYPRYNNYSYTSLQRDPTLRQFYTSPYSNANANANTLTSLYNNYAYHRNIDSILQPSLTNNNYIPNLNSYNYPGQHINNNNMRNRPTPPPPPPRSSYYQPASVISNVNQSRSISSNNNSSSNSSSGYGSGQVRTISQVISIINSFVAEESRRLRENNERNARSSNTNNNGHGETTNGSQSPTTNTTTTNIIEHETRQTGANDNDSNNYPVVVADDSGNETSFDGRMAVEKEMNNLEKNDQVISLPLPPAPSELEELSISGRPGIEIEIDEIIDESDGEMETEFSGESHEESHEETPVICSDPDQEIKDQNEFILVNEQKQNTAEQQCVC